MQNVPGVGHITIDKNEIMQRKVISAIDAVALRRPAERGVGNAEAGCARGEVGPGIKRAIERNLGKIRFITLNQGDEIVI